MKTRHNVGMRLFEVLWLWEGEDRSCAIMEVEEGGQKRLIGAEVFGPFDTPKDVASWVWSRLHLDTGAPMA